MNAADCQSMAELDTQLDECRNWIDRDIEPEEAATMLFDLAQAVKDATKAFKFTPSPERCKLVLNLQRALGDATNHPSLPVLTHRLADNWASSMRLIKNAMADYIGALS